MKEFNQQLHDDVVRLKKLKIKKDKTDYRKFMTVVTRRHKLSKTTIEAEMRKVTPGLYRSITWDMRYRPITDEEVRMVYELLYQNYTIEKVKSIMEEKLGGNYSDTRMAKIRVEMEKRLFELDSDKSTIFGGGIRQLFIEYCDLDLLDPSRTKDLLLLGKEYKVNCGVIKNAINSIILSCEHDGISTQELQRIRMENILSKKIESMSESSQVSMLDLRSAEIVRRSQEKSQSAEKLSPDGKVLMACCMELRPDLSYTEIYGIARKHIEETKGTTEAIEPDFRPANDEFQQALLNTPGSGFASAEVVQKAIEEGYFDNENDESDRWK
jgi:hypothetical protein